MSVKKNNIVLFTLLLVVLFFIASKYDISLFDRGGQQAERKQSLSKLSDVLEYINDLYVDPVDWDKTIQGSIEGALKTLDPHSVYITNEDAQTNEENFQGKYQGIGIQFDVIDGYVTVISVISGSPAEEVGLQSGDQITRIEGHSAYNLTTTEVPNKLKGPKGSEVNVTIRRQGIDEPFDVTIVRAEIPIYTIYTSFKANEKTGYVWINRFASTTADELEDALRSLEDQGIEQLILDLRGNGGGFLRQAVEVAGKFIGGHKKVVYTKGRMSRFDEEYYSDDFGRSNIRDYPLIVLIDHASASASEIVAGAIQDYDRGLIVGMNSFGKGLVQNEFVLNDKSRLRLTISKYYTPSGRLIQRPYKGKDLEEYYLGDLVDSTRSESRVDSDSTLERPVFYTEAGRNVFGGGGITPDVKVKYESFSKSKMMTQQFSQKRVFFEVASGFVHTNPYWTKDFERFFDRYEVEQSLLKQLKKAAREKEIPFSDDDFSADLPYLKNRLKAEIARNIWGMSYFYRVLLQHDNQYEKALDLFDEAVTIMALKQAG